MKTLNRVSRCAPTGQRPLTDEEFVYDQYVILCSTVPVPERLPGVPRIAALLKRWLLGTHHGAIDLRHVNYYLDEFTFRLKRRKSLSRGMQFYRFIQQFAVAPPATYANIRDNRYPLQKTQRRR